MRLLTLSIATLLLLTMTSCGEEESNRQSASAKGNISVTLLSPALAGREEERAVTLTDCTPNFGAGVVAGKCFTPAKFTAKASKISIFSSGSASGTGPSRIIDLAAAPSGSGLDGPFGVRGLASFNFAASTTNRNQYSEDNVQDNSSSATVYDNISVDLGSADMQIEIPSGNGNVTNKYWTIRYVFSPQNPLNASAFTSCPSDTSTRTKLTNDGNLYSSPASFQAGDILLCQKALSTDICADSDFLYINSTDGTTASTRPATPVQFTNQYWISDPTCTDSGSSPSMAFGTASFNATITSPFKLTKTLNENVGGTPYYDYSHTATCVVSSGACTGSTTTGQSLTVSVSFDLSNAVFAPTANVNLETDTEVSLRQNLNKIAPKNFYRGSIAAAAGEPTQNVNITSTVSVTQTTTRNAMLDDVKP